VWATLQRVRSRLRASIGDVSECSARVDAQITGGAGAVLAQHRGVEVASGYVTALSPA
jgi:hypothetical protein